MIGQLNPTATSIQESARSYESNVGIGWAIADWPLAVNLAGNWDALCPETRALYRRFVDDQTFVLEFVGLTSRVLPRLAFAFCLPCL